MVVRKFFAVFFLFLASPLLQAQDEADIFAHVAPLETILLDGTGLSADIAPLEIKTLDTLTLIEDKSAKPKKPSKPLKPPLPNRTFEVSLLNLSFNVSNNLVGVPHILREAIYVDFNHLVKWGFKLNLNAAVQPLSFKYNEEDQWGFGLDIAHIDIMGNVSLPGKLLSLKAIKRPREFGIGGAVFVDVGVPFSFHSDDYIVKIRPAIYLPIMYSEPIMVYRYKKSKDGARFEVDYGLRLYSLGNTEQLFGGDMSGIFQDIGIKRFGYDFRLSIERPYNARTNIGVELVNIPIPFVGGKLEHYMSFKDTASFDTGEFDLMSLVEGGQLGDKTVVIPDETEFKYGRKEIKVYRPFKTLAYVRYRVPQKDNLTLIPTLGFSINKLYPRIFGVEGGLNACWDFSNRVITTLGFGYLDRTWKHSVDFAFNLRAFEFDIGLSLQSPSFIRSFLLTGIGINFGLKFGW